MVISHSEKLCFIRVTKTASLSVAVWLKEYYQAFEVLYRASVHLWTNHIAGDHFRFTVVRNPYSRLVSLWNHHLPDRLFEGVTTFDEFVTRIIMRDTIEAKYATQTRFLRGCKLSRVLRYEKLEGELESLPFVEPEQLENLPRLHFFGKYAPWQTFYSRQTADKVFEWAREDFEQYGYERLSV